MWPIVVDSLMRGDEYPPLSVAEFGGNVPESECAKASVT